MEKYIKYKRFTRELNLVFLKSGDEGIQIFLDEISSGGWDIISYDETIKDIHTILITIIAGKKQSTIL